MAYSRWVFGHKVPLMLMSYLGALKTWLYVPVFHFWTPTASSVRTPMLLAGTATLWLFFVILHKIAGSRAAVAGCLLLVTDASFLLTTCYDWGPVALQHLLFVGGLVLLLRFHESGEVASLGGAFFLFGLGMWDKALFSWNLAGLAVAGGAVFAREIRRAASVRAVLAAAVGFTAGALPLILYNGSYRLETFRSNTGWSAEDLRGKAYLARYAMEGRALFGYIVAEDDEGGPPRKPRRALARAAARLSDLAGRPRASLGWWGFVAALLLSPLLWRRYGWKGPTRAVAFAMVFLATGWLMMALNQGTGGGLHHVVLLWPMPQLIMAVVFAGVLPRASAAIAAVIAFSGLLVLNTYYTQMQRNGTTVTWTDAIFDLSQVMRQIPAREVYVLDWGIIDGLRLLNRGALPLQVGSDPVSKPSPGADDLSAVREWTSTPSSVFISHADGSEFQPGAARRMEALAAAFGHRRETLAMIADRNGRPRFQVFRFRQ
ncbi:MAG: hypothetical protein M1436_01685 [Acidobacteria bacterium]|nr:hypothetical protein [Acidobacteriota bacterium]